MQRAVFHKKNQNDFHKGQGQMKHLLYLICLLGFTSTALLVQGQGSSSPDEAARSAAIKLFDNLTEDQKKMVVLPGNDKDRYAEIFPTTKRPGLAFNQLTPDQKPLVEQMIRSMTSEYGATRCLEVAKQTGDGGRYLTFYGPPSSDSKFAWRVATHHLTLIYAEFGKDQVNEFGPVLLGGNPVKELWDQEDKILVDLYANLSPEEAKAIQGKGNAGSGSPIHPMAPQISSLNEKARPLARKLLQQRLAVFSADRRKIIENIIEKEGGADNLRITIWGDPKKGRAAGGNYSWRIGNETIVCDWQGLGKEHIHMTLRARKKA
jgi:hypothetical protein